MTDHVKVRFSGSTRMTVSGTMTVPRDLWDKKNPDDAWSEEVEEYIVQNVDGLDHFHPETVDDSDIDLDDVKIVEEDGGS